MPVNAEQSSDLITSDEWWVMSERETASWVMSNVWVMKYKLGNEWVMNYEIGNEWVMKYELILDPKHPYSMQLLHQDRGHKDGHKDTLYTDTNHLFILYQQDCSRMQLIPSLHGISLHMYYSTTTSLRGSLYENSRPTEESHRIYNFLCHFVPLP